MEIETNDINKLVEKARQGDQQAMHKLYRMYLPAMYNSCIRIVANQFDAEDIIQESFISAFSEINRFRGESSFGTWLKRIVINKSLNHIRSKKLSIVNYENIQIEDTDSEVDDLPYISMEIIHEGIKSLPEKARVVLNLYLLEGYMHKEIAGMLGISESTSRSQYIRAKDLLKDILVKEIKKVKNGLVKL
ncbi:MAG: RNA polymerase sigma factor [Bacteroidia bacterium]|nr:RNA polymerase sigma factor [Bacteroidia bacterium]